MIIWRENVYRLCLLPLGLSLAAVVPVSAQPGDGGSLTRPEVEATIRQVAEALRSGRQAQTGAVVSDLAGTAAMLKRGSANAATLRAIAVDARSTPLESRLASILLARVETPEVFTAVAPYYESDVEDPLSSLAPMPREGRRADRGKLKAVALDLLHPDTRAVVAAHPEVYAEMRAAVRDLMEEARKQERGDEQARSRLLGELDQSLQAIEERYKVAGEDFVRLAEASGVPLRPLPKLDRRYLPAWEEGLVRSDVAWPMKGTLLQVVASFENAGSMPIIALFAEQALVHEPTPAVDGVRCELLVSQAVAILADRPRPESLFALADIIVHAEGDKQVELQRMIGKRVTEAERWTRMLDSLQGDARFGGSVRELREAAARWKEHEPTSHGGQRP